MNKLTAIALAVGFVFTSCTSDDSEETVIPKGDYENGLLIVEEGSFGQGNGSVSYISNDLSVVESGVFDNVNNELLGDTAQSITFLENLAYVIVNGSSKIEVVNRYTFQSIATINTGLVSPRYMAIVNGKGYVTDWGDGFVSTDDYIAVIDLNSNSVESTIPVSEGPEELVVKGDTIYVAHKGGYSQNNIVSLINTVTNEVFNTLVVGDVPNTIQLDNEGNVWVLCEGNPDYTTNETAGKLSKINTVNNTVSSIDFGSITNHPKHLYFSNNSLYYYLDGGVYKIGVSETALPLNPEFSGVSFYDFSIKNNQLFGLDHNSYSAIESFLRVYDLSTNTETTSINLGPFAGEVYFN